MASLLYISSTENPADSPRRAPAVVAAVGCAHSGSSRLPRLRPALSRRPGSGSSAARSARQPSLPAVLRPLGVGVVSLPKTSQPPASQAAFFCRVRDFHRVTVLSMARKGTIFNANSFRLLFTSLARAPKSK